MVYNGQGNVVLYIGELTVKLYIVRVDHRQEVTEGYVDVPAVWPRPQQGGAGLGEGAVVVGGLGAVLGKPGESQSVSQHSRRYRAAVIPAPPHQHHPQPRHATLCPELVVGVAGGGGHRVTRYLHGCRLVGAGGERGDTTVRSVMTLGYTMPGQQAFTKCRQLPIYIISRYNKLLTSIIIHLAFYF